MDLYILDNLVPTKAELHVWQEWYSEEACLIDRSEVDGMLVETRFLSCDRGFRDPDGMVMLFETEITGGAYHEALWRSPTLGGAKYWHYYCVAMLKGELTELDLED